MINKSNFPIFKQLPRLIYLDAAATSQKPLQVIERERDWYRQENANVHRSIYDISYNATALYEQARSNIAKFFDVATVETIFIKNATEGLNLIAFSIEHLIKPNSTIVVSELEHHSNLLPWIRLAKRRKAKLIQLPTINGKIDLKTAKKLINKKTALVAICHVSNVMGTIQPVKQISTLAKSVGAYLVVDGAQAVPHMKVKPWKLGADAYVFSGHKAYGPMGIGVVFIKIDLATKLDPFMVGGEMVETVSLKQQNWREMPWKFEAGTPNVGGALALEKALLLLNQNWPEHIEKELKLRNQLHKVLNKKGINLISPQDAELPLASFVVTGRHTHDIESLLNEDNIAVRSGYLCSMPYLKKTNPGGVIRVSLGLWNTMEDLDNLNISLANILKGL